MTTHKIIGCDHKWVVVGSEAKLSEPLVVTKWIYRCENCEDVGTSFMEYRGEMYVTDQEHGVRRVVVSKAGEIDLEYMSSFCDHKLIPRDNEA